MTGWLIIRIGGQSRLTGYWMRGLLVTVGGLAGPQRSNATEGDDVYLQARVYNYSLKDITADNTIHVRFYRQPWDETANAASGDSVLIDELLLTNGLPAFNSETSTDPNWTTVTTTFGPTGLGDTYQVFWVVVWIEDASGDLVAELPAHGLSALPGDLTSIGDVPLEMVTISDTTSRHHTTSFTNNTGYLHQVFYIASSTPAPLPEATPASTALTVEEAKASSPSVARGGRVSLSARLFSPIDRDGVYVLFYDGDPATATAFDIEVLSHIRRGGRHEVRVPYHARTCGLHDIAIVVAPGKADETREHISVDVTCSTPTPTPLPFIEDDDGCALQRQPRASAGTWGMLLLVGALLARRRSRGRDRPSC